MQNYQSYLPRKRSKLRLWIGRYFYIFRRYFEWYFSKIQFATQKSPETLPYLISTHHSTLIRQLKNVEMWLQYNKVINLKLALEQMNGIRIDITFVDLSIRGMTHQPNSNQPINFRVRETIFTRFNQRLGLVTFCQITDF
jgi:hypothetical protein